MCGLVPETGGLGVLLGHTCYPHIDKATRAALNTPGREALMMPMAVIIHEETSYFYSCQRWNFIRNQCCVCRIFTLRINSVKWQREIGSLSCNFARGLIITIKGTWSQFRDAIDPFKTLNGNRKQSGFKWFWKSEVCVSFMERHVHFSPSANCLFILVTICEEVKNKSKQRLSWVWLRVHSYLYSFGSLLV